MEKFSSAAALREHLGPERPRTFPEILLLVLDAAEEDARMLDYDGRGSAREIIAEATGQDIYGLVRTILETMSTMTIEEEPKRGTCTRPPAGWWCSLDEGHEGPCPARVDHG